LKHIVIIRLAFILIFGTWISLSGQEWNWAKSFATGNSEYIHDVAVDSATGEIFMVGKWFSDMTNVFPSNETPGTDFSATYGDSDGFVAKLDKYGSVIWAFRIGGPGADAVEAIVLDQSGNIFICGTIDTGLNHFVGVSSLTTDSVINNSANTNAFVAKYTSEGYLEWVSNGEGGIHATATAIVCTSSEVYIAGTFQDSIGFNGISHSLSEGNTECFVARFDPDGTPDWIISFGSNSFDYINGLAADDTHVYFVGQFSGNLLYLYDKDETQVAAPVNAVAGNFDAFIGSFSNEGYYNWSRRIFSLTDDITKALQLIADTLFITGGIGDNAVFPGYSDNPVNSSGGKDIFVSAHDKLTGSTVWVRTMDCTDSGDEFGEDISQINDTLFVITGSYRGTLDFFGQQSMIALSNEDVFAAIFYTSGEFLYALSAGGGGNDLGRCVGSNLKNKLYVGGSYNDDISFDSFTLSKEGNDDIFLSEILLPFGYPEPGLASVADSNVCMGDSTLISLAHYSGTISWESSPKGLNNWISYGGENEDSLLVSPAFDMDYRAKVQIDSMIDTSNIVSVKTLALPTADISGDTNLCEGESALLKIHLTGDKPWDVSYANETDTSHITGITDADYSMDITPYSNTSYKITAVTDSTGCIGLAESSITITVGQIPLADPGSGGAVCGSEYSLGARLETGEGSWEQVSGPGSSQFLPDSNTSEAVVQVDNYGEYQFRWKVIDNVCQEDSVIQLNFYEMPEALVGADIAACGTSTEMNANEDIGTGNWELLAGPGDVLFTPGQYNTQVELAGQDFGIYEFVWILTNGACIDSDTIQVEFIENPVAEAGPDIAVCGYEAELNASATAGTGYWEYISGPGNIILGDAQNLSTKVTADGYGIYQVRRHEQNRICYDFDDAEVSFYEPPVADAGMDQELDYYFETNLDAKPDHYESGEWTVLEGSGEIIDINSPGTKVTNLSTGINRFQWTVMNPGCLTSDEVIIKVNELILPSVITPNGDNKNEYFIVPGIENYTPASLTIIDRWGNEMYYDPDYSNDWNGLHKSGRELTNDTYFYLLKLSNADVFTGYIMINR